MSGTNCTYRAQEENIRNTTGHRAEQDEPDIPLVNKISIVQLNSYFTGIESTHEAVIGVQSRT